MTTDTSEKGLEALIVESLICDAGYVSGRPEDYDRDHAVDLTKLVEFLKATQPDELAALELEADGPKRAQFLSRLQGEVAKRGIIDVLRKGVRHGPVSIELFCAAPSPGNLKAAERYAANIFSVTRQLRYSKDETQLALDLGLFINGLPIATFELKNRLTKQTVEDAIQQYKRDRDPRELLFQFGRCMVHFAVDDQEVRMCAHLQGKHSWFLPFNKGFNDGAGNPPNPGGLKTDYLWNEVLTKDNLTDILENYAQVLEEKDNKGRKKRRQIFPRYHQLAVVRALLADAKKNGVGRRYLIQHSAGSGKSNSIAWLAHQMVGLQRAGKPVFDSVIVVTDRRVLDRQIRDTIKQFAQVGSVVGHAERSGDLRRFLQAGKKIIITTVQKFPFILDEIGNEHRRQKFAIVIDEAHSGQGGRTTAKMHAALSEEGEEEEETIEDRINRIMESRKLLKNASYFAFTATPKNKTLELFGKKQRNGQFRPFHAYTMKQAIEEGFILDVLKCYTPVNSYYRLVKTIEDDPEFDTRKALKKLRKYVEGHEHAIREKAEIMIDHFHDQVVARRKICGHARAMVVTTSIKQAMQYKVAFDAYLEQRKSPFRAIVAFSGDHEFRGEENVNEAKMNGFPSSAIPERFREDPYRFLIVAEKYQTGFDEPLLHTMYVDKVLSGIKAVQTLSRLNRAHPDKHDTFVLDFVNDADTMEQAFSDYYRTTVLSRETDPNKLHDLMGDLDRFQVYAWPAVEQFVELFLGGAGRDQLDPILDACVATYNAELDEDAQVAFKGKAKMFVRTYSFLAAVLPYSFREWELLATFLNFLIPKLPAPQEEDLSKGVLESIDMDSYRVEVQAQIDISLADEDATLDPVPLGGSGGKPEAEIDLLSNIVKAFNDQWGNIPWKDADKVRKVITEEIPTKVSADKAYQNARKNSDKQAARLEHDRALARVMTDLLADHTELFKQFSDNASFQKWLKDTVFNMTYEDDVA
ncbi:MAG: type I restriction endonuclease subunit R [Thermoguttaceae bacterium]|jgi:type I restriction enzyme R subunit